MAQRKKLSYDAAVTEASAGPTGSSGAGQPRRAVPAEARAEGFVS